MRNYLTVYIMILFTFFLPAHAETHRPQDFLNSISGAKNEGEQIYNHFCVTCHAQKPLIALGAPKIRNNDDWESRLKKGALALYENTLNGINAMPPRGGCFECSDDQLVLSIIEMLPKNTKLGPFYKLRDHKRYKE